MTSNSSGYVTAGESDDSYSIVASHQDDSDDSEQFVVVSPDGGSFVNKAPPTENHQ